MSKAANILQLFYSASTTATPHAQGDSYLILGSTKSNNKSVPFNTDTHWYPIQVLSCLFRLAGIGARHLLYLLVNPAAGIKGVRGSMSLGITL